MERFKRFLSKLPPQTPYLVFLFLVFLGIFITNFPGEGKFLTGWDNLHPEFNIGLNLRRVFDIWQPFQGLGLVGGHGYSATLPHTLAIFLLSLVFPLYSLRALFTFLTLLIGAFGVFFVARHVLERNHEKEEFLLNSSSLIAALFYMLSIGTVQNFYIQLEAFIVHFAFLPWLILTLWKYLEKPTRRHLALFVLANFLILPAQFIPPLFIVEGIIVLCILVTFYLSHKSRASIKRGILALLAIFLVNAYWFLPFSYYTLFYSKNYLNAYNNIQSTSEFIQKNLKYGDIQSVPILKSFLFEANDIDTSGNLFPILKPWIDHLNNPLILTLSYGLFFLGIIGVIFLLKKRNLDFSSKSMLLIFGVVFTLFATSIPPFSFVTVILRLSNLFEQAFRVTFTKISIAYVFSLSFFIGAGYSFLIHKISVKRAKRIFFLILTLLLIVYAIPSFKGNFLYQNVKTKIPQDYFSLFSYMNTRPETERVMNLSQGWNWGWTLYNWGYTGSGFLWYGMGQPILDRAFDVWSPYNENYYWEVERALFSKDFAKVDSLLEKYQIEWVIYDPTVVSYPGERQPIYRDAIGEYLKNGQNFKLEKEFGKVKLYKVKLSNKPQSDILEYSNLPNILPTYTWTSLDEAASLSNIYYSDAKDSIEAYFPFRSVFTSRKVGEEEFKIDRSDTGLTLSNNIPKQFVGKTVQEDFSDSFIPARLKVEKTDNNNFKISVSYSYPSISKAVSNDVSWDVFIPNPDNLSLNVNSDFFALTSYGQFIPFDKEINLSASKNNVFNFLNDAEVPSTKVLNLQTAPSSTSLIESETASVKIPFTSGYLSYNSFDDPNFYNHKESNCLAEVEGKQKVANEGNETSLLFKTGKEQKTCFDIILDNLSQSTGYIIEVQSKHEKGEALQLAIVSQQPKKTEYQVSLPKDNKFRYSYLIIPAMQRDGLGYSLHFENDSTIQGDTINQLKSVRVTPIPYSYLTKLKIGELSKSIPINADYNSEKIFSGFYSFQVQNNAKFVVLSQSFDKGWVAFGKPAGKHVFVNNWENGWEVKDLGQMYVLFVPELLVVVGMLLSVSVVLLILKKRTL